MCTGRARGSKKAKRREQKRKSRNRESRPEARLPEAWTAAKAGVQSLDIQARTGSIYLALVPSPSRGFSSSTGVFNPEIFNVGGFAPVFTTTSLGSLEKSALQKF